MKNKIVETIKNILIVVLIFLIIFETQRFYLNFHNVDLTYNIQYISCNLGIGNVTDIGSDLVERPIENYYIIGMTNLKDYFIYGILTMFILGYLIADKFKEEREW